ncbi:phage terminase small subunit [Weissella oryzae SG25]|uniref:Phage terminase small subunit n=1 Tax=Weissella oryzae (strain DSM 25784 / JCM 18191 / LMG 30913 / SG25) TaxID=1329250 RepID=A0A069CW31_WEIOS|nr:terminase small subunit [Weissella oryzae]GAK32010.1 phage terminase small subunit [Weissella oryzae SG25]
MKLTEKQKRFADLYIKLGNATKAAIKAGYSNKTAAAIGAENLIKPNIKNYIETAMLKIESERIMTATEALEGITRIARGEELETVVVSTPMGAEAVKKPPDLKTRMSAYKEILKRYPDNDRMLNAQIRKLEADADMAEAKAKVFDGEVESITLNITQFKEDDDD